MLYQSDIYTTKIDTSTLYSDLSVKIHGFLMSRLPSDFAAELHDGTVNPFSVYTFDGGDYNITRVAALNDKAGQIINVLRNTDEIKIFGADSNPEIMHTEISDPISVDELSSCFPGNKYRLCFITPAMFRRQGQWHCEPELPSYFLSAAAKLEHLENIIIDKQTVFDEFSQIKIDGYRIQSTPFISGSKKFYGMTGEIDVTLPPKKEEGEIIRLLLAYTSFCGAGAMTPQGMGGFALVPRSKGRK